MVTERGEQNPLAIFITNEFASFNVLDYSSANGSFSFATAGAEGARVA